MRRWRKRVWTPVLALAAASAALAAEITTSGFNATGMNSNMTAGTWNTFGQLGYLKSGTLYTIGVTNGASLTMSPAANYLDARVYYRAVIYEDTNPDVVVWQSAPQGQPPWVKLIPDVSLTRVWTPSPPYWNTTNPMWYKVQSGPSLPIGLAGEAQL